MIEVWKIGNRRDVYFDQDKDMSTFAPARIELTFNRRKYVAVSEEDYKRLVSDYVPSLPPTDDKGNRDAVRFAEASIARNIIRRRKAAGLSQKELATKAGIAVEVLNRAERGTVISSTRTLPKIEVVLKRLGQ